ncbi:LacI family DNA-binding transcriptional regulator [uncultured Fusobacterium sp.]|uniref:LacI family DNA-binding transcriptional regulator n=1 Tax=uncultured Fusobacterium sp. TaxID=159267 RepID=UPI00258DC067|nr:LacI family DNA-binding transcriptional regulator [uncultured Fusobacterium sp.]
MTMKDIAYELGISVATVSRVINGQNNVREETKKKVLEYVNEKGYTPNEIARSLSRKENKTIALLVPNISNPFFGNLIDSICKYFRLCHNKWLILTRNSV